SSASARARNRPSTLCTRSLAKLADEVSPSTAPDWAPSITSASANRRSAPASARASSTTATAGTSWDCSPWSAKAGCEEPTEDRQAPLPPPTPSPTAGRGGARTRPALAPPLPPWERGLGGEGRLRQAAVPVLRADHRPAQLLRLDRLE